MDTLDSLCASQQLKVELEPRSSLALHGHMLGDISHITVTHSEPRKMVLQVAYQENVLGSFSELQLLGRACASDLSEHTQVRGAFHSVSR